MPAEVTARHARAHHKPVTYACCLRPGCRLVLSQDECLPLYEVYVPQELLDLHKSAVVHSRLSALLSVTVRQAAMQALERGGCWLLQRTRVSVCVFVIDGHTVSAPRRFDSAGRCLDTSVHAALLSPSGRGCSTVLSETQGIKMLGTVVVFFERITMFISYKCRLFV